MKAILRLSFLCSLLLAAPAVFAEQQMPAAPDIGFADRLLEHFRHDYRTAALPLKDLSGKSQLRLGVAYASSLRSNKEQFEFSIGTERVILNSSNPRVYFTKLFNPGDSYRVTQVSGPRPCGFSGDQQGTFGSQDIVVSANCGYPPLSIFKLEVSGIVQGETFGFSDNYGRSFSMPFSATMSLGGFPQGDDYVISQTSGPRTCRMTLNQGVVPASPITVKADCAKNPAPTPIPNPSGSFKEFDLVSRSSDDRVFGTFYDAFSPVIGGKGDDEGRFAAFVTYAKGLGGSGKYRQVVWRDRKTGETRIASAGLNGIEGNQNSDKPAISADGRSVAFESYATNLVPVDSNGVRDVFVWNADTNTVTAVSENRGVETNAEAFEPTISGNGDLIAFSSSAGNLTPGVDGTSTVNVYLRDMRSGSVTLISKDEKTGKGGGGSRPSISADGSRIAFYNYFPLTKEDQNNLWDIYVWQSGSPKLKRITKTSAGGEKNQGDESSSRVVAPSISGDGRFVTFATTATNMIGSDTMKFQNAYLAEIETGRVTILSSLNGAPGNGDSPFGQGEAIPITFDGRRTVFSTKASNLNGRLVLQDLTEGGAAKVVVPAKIDGVETSVSVPSISQTGKCVIFGSNARMDKRFPSSGIFVTCR